MTFDRKEALEVLKVQTLMYRQKPYAELRALAREPETFEVTAASGTTYQLEFQVAAYKGSDELLILCSIDDMGWSAFVPLTVAFRAHSDGSVGEIEGDVPASVPGSSSP